MTISPKRAEMQGLHAGDLPGLYQVADGVSVQGQATYLAATAARGALVVAAAVLSASVVKPDQEVLLFLVAVAFIGALAVEAWLWAARPERRWYDGRVLAESAKTLAWRYAVGANPFPVRNPAADRELLDRLAGLLHDAPETGIAPADAPAISDGMRRLRSAPLELRRQAYLRHRLEDQREWYGEKARRHGRQATRWRGALLAAEVTGVVLAFARAVGWLGLDLAGVVAAVVTAGAAWLAVRQHESVARAYTLAHGELTIALERLRAVRREDAWAEEAADAEEAVSREHTMWRASRSRS